MKRFFFKGGGAKRRFSINPIALLLWGWLLVVLGFETATSYVLAILLHEFAHFVVAKKLGYRLTRFCISPYGFSLDYVGQNIDFQDEIKIAFAGPVVNLISAFFVVGIWWIFPVFYNFSAVFVEVSVLLALFNLLPAFPLDGGRIFVGLASHFVQTKTAKKVTIAFNFLLCAVFFVMFIISVFVNFNPSLLLFSVFLGGGVLELSSGSRFEKINIFSKKPKKFASARVLIVTEDTKILQLIKKMQSSRTQVFCLVCENGRIINLSEQMVVSFALSFGVEASLKEVLLTKK